jgi:hypothetical protein
MGLEGKLGGGFLVWGRLACRIGIWGVQSILWCIGCDNYGMVFGWVWMLDVVLRGI